MKSKNIVRTRSKTTTVEQYVLMAMGVMDPFELFYRIMGIPQEGVVVDFFRIKFVTFFRIDRGGGYANII